MSQRSVVGDLQRQVLEGSFKTADQDARTLQSMAYVSSGFGVLGMGGFLAIGAMRAGELVSSGVAAAGMQGGITMCMVGCLGAIALHFFAKHERTAANAVQSAVQKYDEGKSINGIIEDLGGAQMSAKLGVFRVQNGTVQIPNSDMPKSSKGMESSGF